MNIWVVENIDSLIQELEKISQSNILVIVEGYKDKKALAKFGITNVLTLKQALYKVVEFVAENFKKCIILTDLDKEGRKLYSVLSKELRKRKIKVDDKFREFLFKETQLRQIEGIWRYVKRKRKNVMIQQNI